MKSESAGPFWERATCWSVFIYFSFYHFIFEEQLLRDIHRHNSSSNVSNEFHKFPPAASLRQFTIMSRCERNPFLVVAVVVVNCVSRNIWRLGVVHFKC